MHTHKQLALKPLGSTTFGQFIECTSTSRSCGSHTVPKLLRLLKTRFTCWLSAFPRFQFLQATERNKKIDENYGNFNV